MQSIVKDHYFIYAFVVDKFFKAVDWLYRIEDLSVLHTFVVLQNCTNEIAAIEYLK